MSNRYWPMFDIHLSTPELELRHLTEADLASLSNVIPDDAEQNPSSTTYARLDARQNRGAVVHQDYWRARGSWRPESWALSFGVFRDGDLLGYQGLEGDDFVKLRTVDSSSFLAAPVRGCGWGKQMRAAVLALAFGPLGARFAITWAWSDNHASLARRASSGTSTTASRSSSATDKPGRWSTCGSAARRGWHRAGQSRWSSRAWTSAWRSSACTDAVNTGGGSWWGTHVFPLSQVSVRVGEPLSGPCTRRTEMFELSRRVAHRRGAPFTDFRCVEGSAQTLVDT